MLTFRAGKMPLDLNIKKLFQKSLSKYENMSSNNSKRSLEEELFSDEPKKKMKKHQKNYKGRVKKNLPNFGHCPNFLNLPPPLGVVWSAKVWTL